MLKKILFTTALVCASLTAGSIPGNKQYSVTLAQPVTVGTVKLAAGDYKLKVDGPTATFIDSHKKTFTAPVKVESAARKAEVTAVETKTTNGTQQLTTIDLAGADFKLVF